MLPKVREEGGRVGMRGDGVGSGKGGMGKGEERKMHYCATTSKLNKKPIDLETSNKQGSAISQR